MRTLIQDLQQPELRLAVVGHVEWMSFMQVDQLPSAGRVAHAASSIEHPAGGGAVCAVRMAQLSGASVQFFTALGRDEIGERSKRELEAFGLDVHVVWKDQPTRRGVSMVDKGGDRAITVIGERLQPQASDPLPWSTLKDCDGVFVSAADPEALKACRAARVMTATPRVRLGNLRESAIQLDALIGSGMDPDEGLPEELGFPRPLLQIATEGAAGGLLIPGGRYEPSKAPNPSLDSYGCGDSFAAGVTVGLAAGWEVRDAVRLGAKAGAACTTWLGPYASEQKIRS